MTMTMNNEVSVYAGKIGVALILHDRHEIALPTIQRWRDFLPDGAALILVDNASDRGFEDVSYRFYNPVRDAIVKNKCIELLEDLEVTDAFITDDTCYPVDQFWWEPYVRSSEPVMTYQYIDLVGPVKLHDMEEIYRDDRHVAYSKQRSSVMYLKSSVWYTIGGFDNSIEIDGYEDTNLADRAYSAGLTTWRYSDVARSSRLWHSRNEYVEDRRDILNPAAKVRSIQDYEVYLKTRDSRNTKFIEYRESPFLGTPVAITSFFTSHVDTHKVLDRNPNSSPLSDWLELVERSEWGGVIISDELKSIPKGYSSQLMKVGSSRRNSEYQKWVRLYQYLRDNDEVAWVWFSIERTNTPLPPVSRLSPGFLYMEPGVVAGDRETIKQFSHQMISVYDELINTKIDDLKLFKTVVQNSFSTRVRRVPND